jgi:hypothetical protein
VNYSTLKKITAGSSTDAVLVLALVLRKCQDDDSTSATSKFQHLFFVSVDAFTVLLYGFQILAVSMFLCESFIGIE